jgi:hypothetical protein
MSNRRILAQSGAFILYGIDPPEAMFLPYKIEQTPFIVPQDVKKLIRRALDNIGINESTLFPEIDKAAARIKNSYLDESEKTELGPMRALRRFFGLTR